MATYKEKILVVDDDPDVLDSVFDRLDYLGYDVTTACRGEDALKKLAKIRPAILLLDLHLPDMDGTEILRRVKGDPEISVIMITASGTVEKAVETIREGAFDFVPKPFSPHHLEMVIQKALEVQALRRSNHALQEETRQPYREILGDSPTLTQVKKMAQRVATADSTVLLLGENGTGKEVFARAIHRWSSRVDQPFVVINCVALREELLESELFGHEKGAFTGAHQMRRGKLEVAHCGTLFLDEIGDMKPDLQTKLLRFLQEREFERVGGNQTRSVDVRVVAATNRDLRQAVQTGQFREDLFFRLNVVSLTLPPLRERKEDIPALAAFFLLESCQQTKRTPMMTLSKEALAHLIGYRWPGNVRELKNLIERAVVLVAANEIAPEDLPLLPTHTTERRAQTRAEPIQPYHAAMLSYRKNLIVGALRQSEGNQSNAASMLGLQRTYLARLIKQMELSK
jgi:DNA-binding NtrC family response regulator